MKNVYRVEIEVEVEDMDVQRAISVARCHYLEAGGAEEPIDGQSSHCRRIPAEEFVPNAVCAIVELINANTLLERAGIDVVEVSCHEAEGVGTNHSH